jgi:fructose-specific phosphotransferase system IIC component
MFYKGEFPGISSLIGVVIVGFLAGTAAYWVIPIMILPHQLSEYDLKLYPADPSNSEVIDRVSDMLSFVVYMGAIVSAFLTIGLVVLNLLNLTRTSRNQTGLN